MDLYDKMNTINEEDNSNEKKIHKFSRQPQNLKYKLNITETNDFKGVNDLFEVFVCNNDHKEYLVSKNINNYNLDVYTLLDNKKLFSLPGHKNRITTIRYFMDNIYNDEFLISADINGIVILWDIINNYIIKYQINTLYNISSDKGLVIYSCY
jgi:mRNA-degrading endonuclease HigB of HigAB toxin-antitoxin module